MRTTILSPRGQTAAALAAVAGIAGALVAFHYARLDLALSHYDARGHLVVARRIADSLTPGWQQIGAVWLPLPHLLNALPVQIDRFYRTGASAIAISVLSFAVAAGAIAWIVATLTGSRLAAVAGALVFALNPNLLYLQATPMTEPLLLALLLVSIALLMEWCRLPDGDGPPHQPALKLRRFAEASAQAEGGHDSENDPPRRLRLRTATGCAFALACLTRYEAWPVTGTALAAAVWVGWRSGHAWWVAVRRVAGIALIPAAAISAFLLFSRVVVGAWFVDDFFIAENPAQGRPYQAVSEIAWGLRELSGSLVLAAAGVGAAALVIDAVRSRARAGALLALALAGTAAVPFLAFFDGHPYRIRYMVPLVALEAVCAGVAAGRWKLARPFAAACVIALALYDLRPLDASAPMVVEAQWDRPNIEGRAPVTRYLTAHYDNTTVMASMGSLGHYMQDLSRGGFRLRDFLHEGNGDIWLGALVEPRPFAGWMLVEEKAEGGDMLAHLARTNPNLLKGYTKVAEGAGLALYRREPLSAARAH